MTRSLVILAAALVLAGCGGSSEPAEPPPPASGASAGEPPDAAATRVLRAAAVDEFGAPGDEAPWWELVTAMHVDSAQAEVSTSIGGDDESAAVAAQICSAFLDLLPRAELEVERVKVLDRDENTLRRCSR